MHECTSVWRYMYFASFVCGCSHSLPAADVPVFRILLRHHISRYSRELWFIFRSAQVSSPNVALYYYLPFLVKRVFFFFFFFFFLLNAAFAMEIPDLISMYILHHLLSGYPNKCNVPHSSTVFVLYRETIAVCSEIHTKHINALCGQNVELPFVKTSGK